MRNTLKQNEEHSQIKKKKLFVLLSSKKKKKKKTPKKILTKIWKKKYTYITKPSPSMASQAHGEPITGSSLTASPFSTKKKKKIQSQKLNPINPSRRWRLASHHVVAGWQRDQTPIQKQTKHRTQQTKHRAQRCLSKKKKNPQYTNQNQTL